MIKLSNVTLISVDGTYNPINTLKALMYSYKDIEFGSVKLISSVKPKELPKSIRFYQIAKISYLLYNRFILHQLYKYIETEYCLLIQNDGFVLNASKWNNDFFQYDYIGAPWKLPCSHYRVGNGGFSLRSKKLLDFTRELEYKGISKNNEDGIIACSKEEIINQGMKYADINIAYEFSVEDKIPEKEWNRDNCFGFHRFYDYNNYKEKKILENFNL